MTKKCTQERQILNRRIIEVLCEILSEKYDCVITPKFEPLEAINGGNEDDAAFGEEHPELCNTGS